MNRRFFLQILALVGFGSLKTQKPVQAENPNKLPVVRINNNFRIVNGRELFNGIPWSQLQDVYLPVGADNFCSKKKV